MLFRSLMLWFNILWKIAVGFPPTVRSLLNKNNLIYLHLLESPFLVDSLNNMKTITVRTMQHTKPYMAA